MLSHQKLCMYTTQNALLSHFHTKLRVGTGMKDSIGSWHCTCAPLALDSISLVIGTQSCEDIVHDMM